MEIREALVYYILDLKSIHVLLNLEFVVSIAMNVLTDASSVLWFVFLPSCSYFNV